MTQPPPPTTTSDLDFFLAAPAYGATELHARMERWKPPLTAGRVAASVVDEIGEVLFSQGEAGADDPVYFHQKISWVGPMGTAAEFATGRNEYGPAYDRKVIEAARRLRVGVRFAREGRPTGELFVPRTMPTPGKLAEQARVLDVPDRFELTLTKMEHPGVLGRKVMRHKPFQRWFQITMDEHWIQINDQHRKELETINLPVASLLGISHVRSTPIAFLPDEHHALPAPKGWRNNDDLSAWMYSRVLQRLGM